MAGMARQTELKFENELPHHKKVCTEKCYVSVQRVLSYRCVKMVLHISGIGPHNTVLYVCLDDPCYAIVIPSPQGICLIYTPKARGLSSAERFWILIGGTIFI